MKISDQNAAYCANEVKALDRDRYATSMFAPEPVRGDLLALYAFNLEIARIAEIVSEPMIGEIRLQWWREALDGIYAGTPRQHAVVEALALAIDRFHLPRAPFDRLIDARSHDLDEAPSATLEGLVDYAAGTGGALSELAIRICGASDSDVLDAAKEAGTGWALTGILRAVPFHAAQGRVLLPLDLMADQQFDPHGLLQGRSEPGLCNIVMKVHRRAEVAINAARSSSRKVPRRALSALLPVTLASGYLRAIRRAGYDPFVVNYEKGAALRHAVLIINGVLGRY